MIEIKKKDSGENIRLGETEPGKTLLELLQERHIYIEAPCAGKGNCGRCRVKLVRGAAKPGEKARRLLTEAELEEGIRLACEVRPQGDCSIELCFADGEKIASLTGSGNAAAGDGALGSAPDSAGKSAGSGEAKRYGVALDIGTTTLAAVLVDMTGGGRLAAASSVNRQRAYGADVLSRIQAANEGKGGLLRQCICGDIKTLLEELISRAHLAKSAVTELVIAANTTMCHLLRGLSCEGLGAAPFIPADLAMWEGSIQELLDTEEWSGKAVILPGISAFVGADIVAGIYSCGMDLQEEPGFLLDIGTNGEMVLGSRKGFLVTSAAAGPVFEGGNISCGVPGIPGAVSHVALSDGDGGKIKEYDRCSYKTLENRPPVGLCGSGIIDITSELVRTGLVDENGTLAEPWFAEGFPVAENGIRFTQRDIREIQMGKSAIRAGIETLLLEYRKAETDSGKPGQAAAQDPGLPVYLAGGFGYAMDVEKAVRIGMFPGFFAGRVEPAGNSALEGAVRFLLAEEKEAKARLRWIVSHAAEINLAMHPAFQDFYMQYMFFELPE